jgi:hypothetical protein
LDVGPDAGLFNALSVSALGSLSLPKVRIRTAVRTAQKISGPSLHTHRSVNAVCRDGNTTKQSGQHVLTQS